MVVSSTGVSKELIEEGEGVLVLASEGLVEGVEINNDCGHKLIILIL